LKSPWQHRAWLPAGDGWRVLETDDRPLRSGRFPAFEV
jgi:hypothetical protein